MKSLWRRNFNLKSHWKFVTTYIGCPFCNQWVAVNDGEVNSRFKYCFHCGKKLTIEDNANEAEVIK